MALIKCPECGGNISDKAPACVHCGLPLKEYFEEEAKREVREMKESFMRERKERECETKIAVGIEELAGMLSCGTATARRIGEDARARIQIGRRVLYSVKKVEEYIDMIAE